MQKTHCEKCAHFDQQTRICEMSGLKVADSYARNNHMACPEFEQQVGENPGTPKRIRDTEPRKKPEPEANHVKMSLDSGVKKFQQMCLF